MRNKFEFGTLVLALYNGKEIVGEIDSVTNNRRGETRYKIVCINTKEDRSEIVNENDIIYRLSKNPVAKKQLLNNTIK